MRRQLVSWGVLAVLIGATAVARGAEPTAAPTGFRAEFIAEVDSVGKKLTNLAGAMPQEKYGWRPAPGIRSVSEVYVHVAGGNYLLPSFMGVKVPEGINRDMEKTVTEKAKVIETLKKSLEHVRSVAENMSDADLDKKVKFFGGREMTQRALHGRHAQPHARAPGAVDRLRAHERRGAALVRGSRAAGQEVVERSSPAGRGRKHLNFPPRFYVCIR